MVQFPALKNALKVTDYYAVTLEHRNLQQQHLPTLTMSGSQRFNTCQQHDTRGSTPCPWNGNRPWCHHHQQQNTTKIPIIWRIFPQSMVRAGHTWTIPLSSMFNDMRLRPFDSLTHISSSITSIQPSATDALGTFVKRLKNALSYPSIQSQQYSEGLVNSQINHQSSRSRQGTGVASNVISTASFPIHQDSAPPSGRTTGYSPIYDISQTRKRAMSLTEYVPGQSSASMSRSLTSTGTIRDDGLDYHDSLLRESEGDLEMDESLDDFDSSVHLGLPFQLLLVSPWFADAAVQSLWRNLVFHGHDNYQLQSLLSMLLMNDESSNASHLNLDSDRRSPGLGKLKEVNEEQEYGVEFTKEKRDDQNILQYRSKSPHAVDEENVGPAVDVNVFFSRKNGSNEHGPPLKQNENHETRSSWIESLNSSLRQFSRFQGGAGIYGSNTEATITEAGTPIGSIQGSSSSSRPNYLKTRSFTSSGSNLKWNSYATNNKSYPDRTRQPRRRSGGPMWSYRHHVRRVVLNFSHPQASPQMFVKVLDCLKSRCPDQIVALDLHANEKMRDAAGLDKAEELERYFSSGFSKLRYLRLQGGLVDNQLLYALIKGFGSPDCKEGEDIYNKDRSPSLPPFDPPTISMLHTPPCRLTQVFLGPGSITDSAIGKLIDAAGHCLEVFAVTSCVDVGGGALANLLTSCRKLRVLGVHRSLARDKELLDGLGIEQESHNTAIPFAQMNDSLFLSNLIQTDASSSQPEVPERIRKPIVAPLERLELGTVKLTRVVVSEILKGTCDTLRFLVLETQHFSEDLLADVIIPFCTKLEGLHFDDPEYLQRQQQQMQGLGFSAGRRGAHLPKRQFEFGRSKRYFYSDPSNAPQDSQQHQHQQQQQPNNLRYPQTIYPGVENTEKSNAQRVHPPPNVSAWLGETSTDDWVLYGDCALWTSACSPAVSYDNGGADAGSQRLRNLHPRRQPLPLFNAYHGATYMTSMSQSSSHPGGGGGVGVGGNGFYPTMGYRFSEDYDDTLARYQVSRTTIENTLQTLRGLGAFTVKQLDFLMESQGLSELKMMMQQDEMWVQSAGFRALQLFYLLLFLGSIYFGTMRW
ncbi:hypothetical protein BGZ76_000465 [Entomortierella beljakovae]|nr:hypothetical protein BGZ76_000465 [Entomortierella beljakovae]